ncbi:hypothetical protein MKEN_01140100 [Mycena kentingensis (nom. inval.)]|nr:hypothetical protein MKEN_01140100 [Mycena kentingensis (nom. inval.)]
MEAPSWSDTLRATLATSCSCLPCLRHTDPPSDHEYDDPLTPQGSYAARRARADELEGLLADAHNDDGDAAADADAISLHSHLGPRGRRRVPPKTPRHISLWGYSLFGKGKDTAGVKLPDGDSDPLHRSTRRRNTGPSSSTTDLLAAAASEPVPEQLTEEDVERRARRKARKEMKRMAKAVAAQQSNLHDPNMPLSGHPRIPAPFLHISTPSISNLPHLEDDDEADLDGLSYARRPTASGLSASGSQTHSRSSGRSSGSGSNRPYIPASPIPYSSTAAAPGGPPIPKTHKSSSRSKKSTSDRRSTRSKSSATSSTLASPSAATFPTPSPLGREDFGAYAKVQPEFDGTPGGFEADASFDGTPGGFEGFDGTPGGFSIADAHALQDDSPWDRDVVREALPSPGLSSSGRPRTGSLNSGRIGGF